ncbi:transcriptional regulator, LacI family [Natronincola peptidivorans]|uniref:Transcriptional regulator, LacI family n=1 Tax=Natronincola peptidivorans TaxID=426128 RepID=A0A1I0CI38_9FIRM|nr:LacI family DNA-binding transcriptional regulator [Natronincola peptidivorans]SET18801.1 transcriptional regulator, LacI family [Natronincola peptidivorans]
MATINDVAKLAGVSKTTVSRVLNKTAPVNKETELKIIKAMKELSYQPSLMAQGLRTKRSKMIGIVIPSFSNPFYYRFIQELEWEAKKQDYYVIISSASTGEELKKKYVEDLIHRGVDGLIIFSYKEDNKMGDYFLEISKQTPTVFMDNIGNHRDAAFVYADGFNGIKEVVAHLIEKGHKKIGFIKPKESYKVAVDRYEGYKAALADGNLPLENELVFEGNFEIEDGYIAGEYFWSLDRKPSAIVACTDLLAIGTMKYFLNKGMKIPQDIAVAGYDDIELSTIIQPTLTTYKQPIKEISKTTIDLLIDKIEQRDDINKNIAIKGELVIREST